ncbi:MAG TPA: DUF445 family protein [Chitinispirillaceae bacterium]|nr:DUF445 family protein [Chitinispirillaceae bacterium]
MKILIFISIPLISALIGWLTNFIAVKMIFRPRKEIRFLGIRIIGLLPKRKNDLAKKIADTVERELISHNDIKTIIQSEEFHLKTANVIKTRIDEFLCSKVYSSPLLTMFVSPDVTSRLTETVMVELEKEIPVVINSLFEAVESKLDFKKVIEDKIQAFEMNKLESIVYSIASRELKAIEYLGGALGFVVGLIQLAIISLGAVYA